MKRLLTTVLTLAALLLVPTGALAWDHISIHADFSDGSSFGNWGYDQDLNANEVTINVDASSFTDGQTYHFCVRGDANNYYTSSSLSFDFTSASEFDSSGAAHVLTKQEGTMEFKHSSTYSSYTFYLKYGTHWGTTGWYIKVTGNTFGGGSSASTTPLGGNTADGIYLVGNFFNTDGDNVDASRRIFKFNHTGATTYSLDIPATVTAKAKLIIVQDGESYLYGPSADTNINATEIATSGEKNCVLTNSSPGFFQFYTRNDGNSAHEDDGLYTLTLELPTSGSPNVTVSHNPLRRVAYFISTAPGATAQPVYDSRSDVNSDFSNKTWGRVRFDSQYGLYVIGNAIHDNEKATIDMTSSAYGTHKNLRNDNIRPTTNKLFLEGNGGRDFQSSNPYNEVSPGEDCLAPTNLATGLYTVEYNPSNGNTEDSRDAGSYGTGHLGIRGQIIMLGGGTKDAINSVSIVGPVLPATMSGTTWQWASTAGDMTWDETERCYKLSFYTTGEAGQHFRFVINHTQAKNLYETQRTPLIPYNAESYDSNVYSACTVYDPNEVAYTTNGTSEATSEGLDLVFNRPAGHWTVRLYMETDIINGTETSSYRYTITGEESPVIDLTPPSMTIPYTRSDSPNLKLSLVMFNADYYQVKMTVHDDAGDHVYTRDRMPYTTSTSTPPPYSFAYLVHMPDGNIISTNHYVDITNGGSSIFGGTGVDAISGKDFSVTVRLTPVDADGNAIDANIYDEETYTFIEGIHATATPDGGFYINQKEVTVGIDDSRYTPQDMQNITVYYASVDPDLSYNYTFKPLPADGKVTISGNPSRQLYLKPVLNNAAANGLVYSGGRYEFTEDYKGNLPDVDDVLATYYFTYSTSENYRNYLHNQFSSVVTQESTEGFSVFIYTNAGSTPPQIRFKVNSDEVGSWTDMKQLNLSTPALGDDVTIYQGVLPNSSTGYADDDQVYYSVRSADGSCIADYTTCENEWGWKYTVAYYKADSPSLTDFYAIESSEGSNPGADFASLTGLTESQWGVIMGKDQPQGLLSGYLDLKEISEYTCKGGMCADYYNSVFDFTMYLDPSWGGSTAISDVSGSIKSWNGTVAEKQVLAVAPGQTIKQRVKVPQNNNIKDNFIAVQAIVARTSAESTEPVKLSLGGATSFADNESSKSKMGYDEAAAKSSELVVNKYGRVERYMAYADKAAVFSSEQKAVDGMKWFKLEARALTNWDGGTNEGTLDISIANPGAETLYLADVTVLPTEEKYRDYNPESGHTDYSNTPANSGDLISDGNYNLWTNSTGRDFYTTTVHTGYYVSDIEILPYTNDYELEVVVDPRVQSPLRYLLQAPRKSSGIQLSGATPYFGHNAYSFFDRGYNLNAVVFAPKYTVIGMEQGLLTDDDATVDRKHPANVASAQPQYDGTSIYEYDTTADPFSMAYLLLTDTDGSQWGNDHTYGTFYDFSAKGVLFDREALQNQRSTLIVPFDLSPSELEQMLGTGYTAYLFDKVQDESLVMKATTSEIPANTPFVFKTTSATHEMLPATGYLASVDVKASHFGISGDRFAYPLANPAAEVGDIDFMQPSTDNGGYFYGTYMYDTVLGNGEFQYGQVYLYSPSKDYFGRASQTADIRPFRAMFVKGDDVNGARRLNVAWIDEPDTATAISGVPTDSDSKAEWYDLQGRKVGQSVPKAKGVYVVGGKKAIIN